MADLWERMKKTVAEVYTAASGKAVEGVNIGVKKLDEVTIRRELSKEFTDLGGRTYQLLKRDQGDDLPSDATIRHHMGRLEELETRLEEKEQEIQELKATGTEGATSSGTAEGTDSDQGPPDEPDPSGDS